MSLVQLTTRNNGVMASFLFHCGDENCPENYSHNLVSVPEDLPEDMLLFTKCRTCGSPGFHYQYLPGHGVHTTKPEIQLNIVNDAMELKLRLDEEADGKTENFKHNRPVINPAIAQVFGLLEPMLKKLNPRGEGHGPEKCGKHRTDEGPIDQHTGKHQGKV
jgi:hypothetical protein